jgi:hypothetical protein
LYSSSNIVWMINSRTMIWARTCSSDREGIGVYRVLVGKPEGKWPLAWPPRRKWEDNIKMDRQEVGCGVMDWID